MDVAANRGYCRAGSGTSSRSRRPLAVIQALPDGDYTDPRRLNSSLMNWSECRGPCPVAASFSRQGIAEGAMKIPDKRRVGGHFRFSADARNKLKEVLGLSANQVTPALQIYIDDHLRGWPGPRIIENDLWIRHIVGALHEVIQCIEKVPPGHRRLLRYISSESTSSALGDLASIRKSAKASHRQLRRFISPRRGRRRDTGREFCVDGVAVVLLLNGVKVTRWRGSIFEKVLQIVLPEANYSLPVDLSPLTKGPVALVRKMSHDELSLLLEFVL
jgi:hypothetical protein